MKAALRSPLTWGVAVLGTVVVLAVAAPVLAPYGPRALAGGSLEEPSSRHLLGTNDIGQDVLSQVVWGARESLVVAVAAAAVAVVLGTLVGAGAGMLGGRVDEAAMRVVDVFLALPALPLIVLVAALAGPSRVVLILVIGMTGWPGIARVLRAQALTLRARGHVAAARNLGAGPGYVLRRHLVPALGPLIATNFVTWSAVAVFLESALGFLGLGDPGAVSWGRMINTALRHQGLVFTPLWTWWVLPAGLAIAVTVLGFTLVGIGLEHRFNPRARRLL